MSDFFAWLFVGTLDRAFGFFFFLFAAFAALLFGEEILDHVRETLVYCEQRRERRRKAK